MKSTTSNIAARTAGRRLRGVAGALVGVTLLFTAAACDSDDEGDDTTASESENEESTDTDATDNDSADTDSTDEESSDTEQDSGESTDAGDYCGTVQEFGTDVLNDSTAMTDPEAASGLVDAYRQIADAAPSDIAADWSAMADALETISDIDMSDPDAAAELEGLDDMMGAAQRISDHIMSECM
ncbi:hypothetical protein [Phytoactinopolyspora halotolerans]|uniref:Uncharacterized protein n=1 Tax=Phytoactinopolyspora halotolerans TaxID=1981512 RepID=A0A6L9SAH1_9ACTN|nr:hypothetical protein [Phytoactinopolyspora halotolerans]NEE01611.1 hypothetical protein [Phytoactinopolyspora halotolerans]